MYHIDEKYPGAFFDQFPVYAEKILDRIEREMKEDEESEKAEKMWYRDKSDKGLRVYEKDLALHAEIGDPYGTIPGGSGKGAAFKADRNGWHLKLRF